MTPETLSLWAPRPQRVTAVANGHRIELVRDENDWWRPAELPAELTDRVGGEVDYGFLLDDDPTPLPDPRSRHQPHGVHGLSQSYDPSGFAWHDQLWTGRQLAGTVIYELHVGTFTGEGTLDAAIAHLDHLVDLGIDAVELMPVNAFNGEHNWGYDGVGWYAVQHSYGGPRAYQEFVDACHQRGIAVIQDVVYNHLGPSGNYLPRFGPYLSEGRGNTWGDSINLDGPDSDEVRAYIIENALMWLRDYHVDGLRLDAVHALVDSRAQHILEELAGEVDALSAHLRRPLTLIAESDLNDPRLITPTQAGGYGLTGQWSDDFHHALYAGLTGDTSGYYADFGSPSALAKIIERGYFHDGTGSSFRGRSHGRPLDQERTATWRLVVCSDNHDQIGNRAAGQRLSSMVDHRRLQLASLVTLLAPFTPMIFMGEEWGASTPWQFFTSHPEPELGRAVAEGRLQEFAGMSWDTSSVPDPQDPQTFLRSKLDWSEPRTGEHAELLAFTGQLLRLRRELPDITDPRFYRSTATADDVHRTLTVRRGELVIVINFADTENSVQLGAPVDGELLTVGEAVFDNARSVRLGAHSALVGSVGQPL
ncbi:malto-oligosyltrehalose trehalohydrolase [Microlunatus sp. Gsoil 973]|nr:malto-oligosyltrehalose trehalohydrolase [Microlunatus sp. Gsoil 973]